ncbi:MAG: glycogen/starch synthase, partial [Planctomycetales bacterium]
MNILIASSEAVPFAKTGGLADVCGALPIELGKLGHEVSLIMPAYRGIRDRGVPVELTGISFDIPIGGNMVSGELLRGNLPGSHVPVYFVRQDESLDRNGFYGEDGSDYDDNCQRFVFFCRAVLETIRRLPLEIDLIHANDWMTGLIPAYLKIEGAGVPPFERTASVMTIHNLAYQGTFWHGDMLL